MNSESRTPEEPSNPCYECGYDLTMVQSVPPPNAPCPNCGSVQSLYPGGDDFSDFLVPEACLPAIGSCTKEEALRKMVNALISAGAISGVDCQELVEGLMKREELASTGVGRNIGLPHLKHPKVSRLVGCLAHSVEGIDFQSLDGEPVHLLLLYFCPADRPNDGFRAINLMARIL